MPCQYCRFYTGTHCGQYMSIWYNKPCKPKDMCQEYEYDAEKAPKDPTLPLGNMGNYE